MPNAIRKLAEQILKTPKTVSITKSESTNSKITQYYYVVQERERDDALVRLIDYKNPTKKYNPNDKILQALKNIEEIDVLRDFQSKRINVLWDCSHNKE